VGIGEILMADEKVFTARFKVEDDGSIVLDKISGKLVDVGQKGQQSLGQISSSLSIIKLDSLVNLGERALHAGEQLYNMARTVASSTNEIQRMANIAGLSTDMYQKMAYAAKMTDVDVDSLGKGMKILAGHMDDVRKGSGEARSLFENIGISTLDASGKIKSFDNILGDMADRFKSMPNGVEKVALAVNLFGRTGQDLIPFLNEGREGLKGFYEQAERLGIVLDESLIRKGSELDQKFKIAEAAVSSFFKRVVVGAYSAASAMTTYSKSTEEVLRLQPGAAFYLPNEGLGKKPTMQGFELQPPEQVPVYLAQSEAAVKAIEAATQKIAEENYRISDLYDHQNNVLKGMASVREREGQAMQIMAELGIKTEKSAMTEVEAIQRKFETLIGKGFRPEELEQARVKLEEQLKAVAEKYTKPSGWQATGEEGGVRVWSSIRPDQMTKNVSEAVAKSIEEMRKMQRAGSEIMGPTMITVDYKPVRDANEAAMTLRTTLQDLSSRDWPITVTIDQRTLSEDKISIIEDELTKRIQNKQSRLGSIMQKKIEGGVEFSNY
jgi:hypothetical protein